MEKVDALVHVMGDVSMHVKGANILALELAKMHVKGATLLALEVAKMHLNSHVNTF